MILQFAPHKIFCYDDKDYLWVARTGGLYEIDYITKTILGMAGRDSEEMYQEVLNCNSISRDAFYNKLKELEYAEMFSSWRPIRKTEIDFRNLKGVELMVCQTCNMACKYCYGNEGEYNNSGMMSTETACQAIDFVFTHSASEQIGISFFGGEPLMNFGLIKTVVTYAKEKASSTNRNVTFAITTNGTLVNDDILPILRENKFYVVLSIDGDRRGHNMNRVFKTGEGSYDETVKSLGKLSQNRVSIRATATPQNMDYVSIAKALSVHDAESYFIAEAHQCFDTMLKREKLAESYALLIEYFRECLDRGDFEACKKNSNVYLSLQVIAHPTRVLCHCEAIINSIAVDIKGNVYPCHRFVGTKHCIGAVGIEGFGTRRANDVFQTDFWLENRSKCKDCWAQLLCRGGCPHSHMVDTGRCYEADDLFCHSAKHLFEKTVELYLSLSVSEKEQLLL